MPIPAEISVASLSKKAECPFLLAKSECSFKSLVFSFAQFLIYASIHRDTHNLNANKTSQLTKVKMTWCKILDVVLVDK